MTWGDALDVLEAFAGYSLATLPPARVRQALRADRLVIKAPCEDDPLDRYQRRCAYDRERRMLSDNYITMIERAAARAAQRHADPERSAADRAAALKRADERRAAKARGRTCPECGEPVSPKARMGRVPILHPQCNRRKAARDWHNRHKGKRVYAVCTQCPNEFLKRNSRHLTCSPACSASRANARAMTRTGAV